ncbi:cation:proton antiporter [Acetobacterium malicum]|uniref:cation:proton antiporter n=1 Tax=Acetobacterium malicum TaxID=52692 RepID=UPI0004283A2F|nr:cation:proton antiporter [Acetobacterium dehalogenans]
MQEEMLTFVSLLIIAIISSIVPLIVNKIKIVRIPIVVGEILAGIIIGKSGFNLIHIGSELDFLYEIGLAFLMFLAGLEINLKLLKNDDRELNEKIIRKPTFIGIMYFIICFTLSFSISFLLMKVGVVPDVIIFTLVFCSTAVGIVVPTLKEKGLMNSDYGQMILIAAVISDFATMIMLSVYTSWVNQSSFMDLISIILFIPLFLILSRLSHKFVSHKNVSQLRGSTSQIIVRFSYAILLFFIVISLFMKTEIILGAFLAGFLMSVVSERDGNLFFEKLDAIGYGIFISIFFVLVGAKLDIFELISQGETLVLLPLFVFIIYGVNYVSSIVIRLKYSSLESSAASFILSSRLSLIIAAGAIACKMNIIESSLNSIIILTAVVTCTLSPILFDKLNHVNGNYNKK